MQAVAAHPPDDGRRVDVMVGNLTRQQLPNDHPKRPANMLTEILEKKPTKDLNDLQSGNNHTGDETHIKCTGNSFLKKKERKKERKIERNNERKIERKKIERKNPVLNDLQIGNNDTREQTHKTFTENSFFFKE